MKINEKVMLNKDRIYIILLFLLYSFRAFGGIFIVYTALTYLFDIDFIFDANAKDCIIAVLVFLLIDDMATEYLNKKAQRNNIYREYLVKELEKADSLEGSENKKDIILLMLSNNEEIREYFKISKNHAKSSFYFSVIACIIGILMISMALYGVFENRNFDYTIIGTVGGVVTELIAGIVLVIHNKSAMQLNYYYDALHENEKFLAAINMADKLSEEKREEMYIEIIRKQIEVHSGEKNKD